MTAAVATRAGARRLHVVAGLAAFLAMLANVVDIVLGFPSFSSSSWRMFPFRIVGSAPRFSNQDARFVRRQV
jgi:hypothetical protein